MQLALGGLGGNNNTGGGIKDKAQPRGICEHNAGGLTRGAGCAVRVLQLYAEIALARLAMRSGKGGVCRIHHKGKRHALGGGNANGGTVSGAGPAPGTVILEGGFAVCREHGESLRAANVIRGGGQL